MRLTGDQDVRIDFTNPAIQVKGLDLNGDGIIANNGVENNITGRAAGFEIVDAYARNPLNETSITENFKGDIAFDGTGFGGDGVTTDGNIFLGGLGVDTAFGGIGNDFMTGGGIAADRVAVARAAWIAAGGTAANFVAPSDSLSGGRNADFFFVELSALDATDGNRINIDGGTTADDSAAGTVQTAQDADWLLFEGSDDDEPVTINLRDDTTLDVGEGVITQTGSIVSRSGQTVGALSDIENFDASGNLYGFLDSMTDLQIGGRRVDDREVQNGTLNNGIGSSAQIIVNGSEVANIIIGGYDNDRISGNGGNDLLMGGNLSYLINPNMLTIVNDGRDDLFGGAGDDDIVFEADGGNIEGDITQGVIGGGNDTLWLTNLALGTQTATALTTDGFLRFDLDAQDIDIASGYGGADAGTSTVVGVANDHQDQTNYKTGVSRTTVQDMDNVIATGLGAVDYDTDGSNTGDIGHLTQVNQAAYNGNLTLRGTAGSNTLYAAGGEDIIEGRTGDDLLSGGDKKDDFVFQISGQGGTGVGDGIDVIHRQNDVNDNGIWDGTGMDRVAGATVDAGTFGQDFGVNGTSIFGPSTLSVDFAGANLADANVWMGTFSVKIGTATFAIADLAGLKLITTVADLATFVNAAFNAQDTNVTVTAVGTVLTITDSTRTATSGGREFSVTQAAGYDVNLQVQAPGAGALTVPTYVPAGATPAEDRIIFAAYEDRLDGELVDDNGMVNSTGDATTLGGDGYAEDLVVRFNATGTNTQGSATLGDTVIAEDQVWTSTFTNLADEDTVSVSVNGTAFALTMGVAANGTAIAETDAQFVARLASFINSVADANTLAGSLIAANTAGTTVLTLTQGIGGGAGGGAGQNVFMDRPVVTLGNASGGQPATVAITKVGTNSEITLADYDGTGGKLNAANVLFVGGSGMDQGAIIGNGLNAQSASGVANANSRSVLATASATVDGTVNGSNALVLDSMTDVDAVATDFSLHGDDYLIGGVRNDTLIGGTGDDRFQGSASSATVSDVVNGGKDLYVVRTNVAGVTVETVETMNTYEAQQRATTTIAANANVLGVAFLEEDTATGAADGFTDALVFNQNDFTTPATTNFLITVGRATDTERLLQKSGGEGTVQVGTFNSTTSVFTQTQGSTAFSEIEAVRTLAGDGTRAGQGRDTLDVSLISGDVAASFVTAAAANNVSAGVTVNLRSDTSAIRVRADMNANDTNNLGTETINNFLAVAGVENVIGGSANDTVNIDESEVRKDNTFTGGGQTAVLSATVAPTFVPSVNVGAALALGGYGDAIIYDHSDMNNNNVVDANTNATNVAAYNTALAAVVVPTAASADGVINAAGAAMAAIGAGFTTSATDNVDTVTGIVLNALDPLLDTGAEVTAAKFAAYTALSAAVQANYAADQAVFLMRPSVNLKVGTVTDLVTMSGGTMLSDSPVDTLNNVEGISLNDLARSSLRDTLDVTSNVGATVNFETGKVFQGAINANNLLIDIGNMTELENTLMSVTGADTVLMANTMTNNNAVAWTTNTAALGNPDFNNSFAFFRGAVNTVAVANQGLFDIDFGTGTGASTADAINYVNEVNQDIMVVLDLTGTGVDRVVVADAAGIDGDLSTINARVDVLRGADMYYAGGADARFSGIDLSQHTGDLLTVQFSSNATALNAALGTGEDVRNIQIVDGSTSIVKQFIDNGLTTADRALIAGQAAAITAANTAVTAANVAVAAAALTADDNVDNVAAAAQLVAANAQLAAANNQNADFLGHYWNRIEGNDKNETINLTDRESDHNIMMNVFGGANTISYNDDSIGNTLNFDEVVKTGTVDNKQSLTVNLTTNNVLDGTHVHTITGNVGSQRIDGSKTGNDVLNMSAVVGAYAIKLNNVEGSGWKGSIDQYQLDGNNDGLYTTQNVDSIAVSTTVSGYENITGNNANNRYEGNTFVNAITAGTGNDAFVISTFSDVAGDTWLAGTGTDTLVVNVVGAAASTAAFTLGNGALATDQSGAMAGSNSDFEQFENVDASGSTVTTFTMVGRTDVASVLRGGSGNDTLTVSTANSVMDGGVGADSINFGAGAERAVYEAGDSDSASKDTVTGFLSGTDTIAVRVDMAARGLTNVTTAFATGATPVANSGTVKAFYDTTAATLLVDMDANGSYSLSGDLTIGGTGALVAADVQFDILGTTTANSITGAGEVDRIRAGQGADTVVGGDRAAVNEVHSYILAGTGLTAAQTLTLDGFTVIQGATVQGVAVALSDADAVGEAFVRQWNASPTSFVNNAAIQSVTYNAGTNSVDFTFKTTAGDVADTLLGAAGGTGAAIAGAETVSTAFVATAGSDDVFVVVGSIDTQAQADIYKGKYSSQEALNADLGGANLVSLSELTTIRATSDSASGDTIDGGLGNDTVHYYGSVNLTGTTTTSVENVVFHSNVTMTVAQLNAFNAAGTRFTYDAGTHNIVITGLPATGGTLDLTALGVAAAGLKVTLNGVTSLASLTQATGAAFALVSDATIPVDFRVTSPTTVVDQTITYGTVGNDALVDGGVGVTVNYYNALDGDDSFIPGGGADIYNAGGGVDTISYADIVLTTTHTGVTTSGIAINATSAAITAATVAAAAVTAVPASTVVLGGGVGVAGADLAAGTAGYLSATAGASTASMVRDTFTGVERFIGTALADIIYGGAGDEMFTGGTGVDYLSGGAGANTYAYALTADLFTGLAAVDTIVGGSGVDTLSVGTTGTAFAIAGADVWTTRVTSVESIVAVANTAAVTVQLDVTAYAAGVRSVDLSAVTQAVGNVIDIAEYVGTDATTLKGSATGANAITGGAGADSITGGALVDTINGGAGADVIFAGNGADQITIGAGQDQVNLSEAVASADNLIWATAFAAGNTNAATVTDFAFGAGVDTIDIQVNVANGTTVATSALVLIAPVAQASNATATVNDVIFTFAGVGDILSAGTTISTAVANAVVALTSTTDFASASVVAGDSMILQMNDGTNTFVFQYVADATPAVTSAADLTLIGVFNGTTAALTGDFI